MKKHIKKLMNLRFFAIVILLTFSSESFSQEFSKRERHRLERFDIAFDSIKQYNEIELLNLNAFLKSDKQYRRRKNTGIIMASAGALIAGLGIITITSNDADYEAKPFVNILGGFIIATGSATAGLSIPFFCSSNKRKRERNELISKIKG